MRNRLGPIATLISLLLVTSISVQAGPISVSEVIQVIGRHQSTGQGPELRLRNVSPTANSLVDDSATKSSTGSLVTSSQPSSTEVLDTSTGASPVADSLLSGVALSADDSQTNLDVISQGDLQGSICDCGEIPGIETHGFPKWPLLFLAAIPFFFIHHHCDTCDNTPPPPTPTPTPPGVPEPASMLLMGSGLAALAASLRRRHARRNGLANAIAPTEEA